jgi:hypothetical protein
MTLLNTHGIPKKVLLGKEPRLISVARLYRARMIQELFRLAFEAFHLRSTGASDVVMDDWTPLKPRTIKEKQRLLDKGETKPSYLALTSDKKKEVQHLIKGGFSKKDALEMVNDPKAELIGIRTGELVGSLSPGVVTNNRYYGRQDQDWYMDEKEIRIATKVEHANDFDVGNTAANYPIPRPIFPPEGYWDDWITTAHETCIEEVVAYCRQKVIEIKSEDKSNESIKYRASNRPRKIKRSRKK